MNKKYIVRLTEQEREQLNALLRKGTSAAYKIKHANILLKADVDGAAWSDEEIATAFSVHPRTVAGIRGALRGARPRGSSQPQKAGASIPAAALRRRGGGTPHRLALLGAPARTCPVDVAAVGRYRGRVGDCGVDVPCDGQADAQKNALKPHVRTCWVIPPEQSGEFVAHMEEVLGTVPSALQSTHTPGLYGRLLPISLRDM